MLFNRMILPAYCRWYCLLSWGILILIALGIYGQTFGFDFVFDDDQFIVHNPYIYSFDKVYDIGRSLPFTRLIGIYSFALNFYFNGLNPVGYHVFNLLVHLLVTGLAWAIASLLFKITNVKDRGLFPFLIAVLFLVHPCQTQAVSYISQRFESLATLFYLATFYFYLLARLSVDIQRKIILFALALGSALVGIMTKEVAVTIPFFLMAAEWILNPYLGTKNSSQKSSLFGSKKIAVYVIWAAGVFLFCLLFMKLVNSGFSLFFASFPSESHVGDTITLGNYVLTQMRVFLTFLGILTVPINQNVDYDYALSTGILQPPLTIVGMGVIGLMVGLIFKLRQSYPLIALGLAWMLITFSINLVPRTNVIWEHKLYLISFGYLLVLVGVLNVFMSNRRIAIGVLICLIACFSWLSYQRNKVWANEFTLWQDGIVKSPDKVRVYVNLAKANGSEQLRREAINILSQKLEKEPNHYGALMARAALNYRLGFLDLAIADLRRAVLIRPNFIDTYKLSIMYSQQNKKDMALEMLNASIGFNREYVPAYLDRGMLLVQAQQFDGALEDFNKALALEPNGFVALVNRAGVWIALNRYEEALKDLDKALRIKPQHALVEKNRRYCLIKMQESHNLQQK